mmetsp:Transcript_2421/g.5732  ORF Transcript_2421/g.5732 Transcript_2421/m.5732 type:complete len:369 (-) Transcript_2421:1090-2196(-)
MKSGADPHRLERSLGAAGFELLGTHPEPKRLGSWFLPWLPSEGDRESADKSKLFLAASACIIWLGSARMGMEGDDLSVALARSGDFGTARSPGEKLTERSWNRCGLVSVDRLWRGRGVGFGPVGVFGGSLRSQSLGFWLRFVSWSDGEARPPSSAKLTLRPWRGLDIAKWSWILTDCGASGVWLGRELKLLMFWPSSAIEGRWQNEVLRDARARMDKPDAASAWDPPGLIGIGPCSSMLRRMCSLVISPWVMQDLRLCIIERRSCGWTSACPFSGGMPAEGDHGSGTPSAWRLGLGSFPLFSVIHGCSRRASADERFAAVRLRLARMKSSAEGLIFLMLGKKQGLAARIFDTVASPSFPNVGKPMSSS